MPPPRFEGGRYRLPGFCSIGNLEADCKETKTRKQKSLRNVVVFHPPLCPCYKKHAAFWNMKNAPNRPTQTGAASRVARYVEHSSIETPSVSSASGSFRSSLYLSPA